ncbi:hypothetical protein BpHYR1_041419, partial [Brachionus plicatilis]
QKECQWRFLKLYIIEFTYNRITYNRISTSVKKVRLAYEKFCKLGLVVRALLFFENYCIFMKINTLKFQK